MINVLITIAVIILGITALAAALMFWILCKAAKEEFEEEDLCRTCLRWSECNGVDADCPRRK